MHKCFQYAFRMRKGHRPYFKASGKFQRSIYKTIKVDFLELSDRLAIF